MKAQCMQNQLFRTPVPKENLIHLLDKICEPSETDYHIDIHAYKRMKYHEYHVDFLKGLTPYYHWSKQYFVEREFTYNSFVTILRQLSRLHNLSFTTTFTTDYYISRE